MLPSAPRALAAALLLAAALAPATADAFCRTWSCDPSKEKCPSDPANKECAGGDPTKHKPLFWPQKCIGFSLNLAASKKLDANADKARAKFARVADLAFATWQKADCGKGLRPSLAFFDLGFIECDEHEFNGYNTKNPERPTAQGNANLITFRDKWPAQYNTAGNTLALTTLTFNVNSGEIYDADIEINGETELSTSDSDVKNDLQSILTHEIGHFLGLAHSPVEDSTMYAVYQAGSTSYRDLAPDDVSGVCSVYKPDRVDLPTCDPTPRHGYGSKCAVDSPEPDSCSTSGRIGSSMVSGFALAAVAGAAALRARRRRR